MADPAGKVSVYVHHFQYAVVHDARLRHHPMSRNRDLADRCRDLADRCRDLADRCRYCD